MRSRESGSTPKKSVMRPPAARKMGHHYWHALQPLCYYCTAAAAATTNAVDIQQPSLCVFDGLLSHREFCMRIRCHTLLYYTVPSCQCYAIYFTIPYHTILHYAILHRAYVDVCRCLRLRAYDFLQTRFMAVTRTGTLL